MAIVAIAREFAKGKKGEKGAWTAAWTLYTTV
jgi:hypothetical protein